MANIKIFIDFWNFQLSWNANVRPPTDSSQKHVRINWRNLPNTMMSELPGLLGGGQQFVYKATQVYASVNPMRGGPDEKLKRFLTDGLGQLTGYSVKVRDRRVRRESSRDKKQTVERTVEKGVDTLIVTDLFEGAINNSYDIALLISNDSDFVPSVSTIQDRLNKQIIHVGFRQGGHHLRTAAWGHIILNGSILDNLKE